MSAIYKLSIAGIRSFDPSRQETIEFGKPLTLIVGQNGTGKTTVIECLKYASTGIMPPNSKGGAFIHDPNMTSDKETRGEVKLAFTNLNGQSMVTTRTAQVTLGRNTRTFKTLEGQLLLMNRGERTTVSTKCVELDSQVPRFLGVPPAILDYVIFCHQEEGLWPLQEPLQLKKKFDEIFQALKFTKAVDNLKIIKKELAVEVKLLEQSVEHLKLDKERADRTKQKLEKSKEVISTYLKETEILQEELTYVSAESEKLFKSNQDFQTVLSNLQNLKLNHRSLNEQIARLQDTTKLLPDSDEELSYKNANFETILEQTSQQVKVLKDGVSEKQQSLKDLRDQKNKLVREEGQFLGRKAEYETNIIKREDISEKVQREYGLDLMAGDFLKFESELKGVLKKLNRELTSSEQSIQQEESTIEGEIKTLSDSKLKELQHKDYIAADISNIQRDINSIANKINELDVNEGNVEYERSSLEDLEQKLTIFKENNYLESITNEIKAKNNEISTTENELEDLSREISQIHKQSDAHARIALLKDELKFKDKAFTKLKENNEHLLTQHGLEPEDASRSLNKLISNTQSEIKKSQTEYNNQSSKLSQVQSNIQHLESTLVQYNKDIETSQKKYDEVLGDEPIDEYDEIVAGADDDYKLTLENLKMFTTTFAFNKKALEHLQSQHSCYLCHTKFEEGPILKNLTVVLEKQINGTQESEFKSNLEQAQDYQQRVRSVATDVEKILSIKPKLEETSKDLQSKKSELESSKSSLTSVEEQLSQLNESLVSLNSLRTPVNELERLGNELRSLTVQVEEKSKELTAYGYSSKSLEELQESQNEKNNLLKAIRKSVSSLFEQRDSRQREFTVLEGGVKDKRLRISTLERSLVEKESLIKSIEQYKKKVLGLEETAAKSTQVITDFEAQLVELKSKYDTIHHENQIKLDASRSSVSRANEAFESLSRLNQQIDDYTNNISVYLKRCQDSIRSITEAIASSEENIEEIQNTVSEEEMKLANANSELTNLRNNIDIRRLQAELEHVEDEISGIDVVEAEAARVKYQEHSAQLREQYSTLNASLAGKMGEIKQIEDQARQTQKELDTEFKDVTENYRNELARFRFKSVALTDADIYTKAIDTAIMNFHSLKMKETNKIIDDLWKGTYTGTDVDTIQIRSDPLSTTAKNKSYNYRVVMVKNEVELDMRGRCSAGQKVLASIIIRLALSECFGTNCGVIALDEPTTNLDADNIEALARSLSNIIGMRKSQKNFQLIVITHDEKFLNAMNASKYTDHFYRIRRNQAQKSEIDWVKINRISE